MMLQLTASFRCIKIMILISGAAVSLRHISLIIALDYQLSVIG